MTGDEQRGVSHANNGTRPGANASQAEVSAFTAQMAENAKKS